MRKVLVFTSMMLLMALLLVGVVNAASLDKITLPSKPTLSDNVETSYLGDKFKKQGDYIISSKEVYNPIWYPDNHPKKNVATVVAIYQIENVKTGEFRAVRQTWDTDKYKEGSWDLDMTRADWFALKKGSVKGSMTWESSENYVSEEETIFENETDKEVKIVKKYQNWQPITDKEAYKILKLNGNSLTLDPDVSACGTLASAGYYTLNQSLSTTANAGCIIISASHVVFDGNASWIHGNGSSLQYAVQSSGIGIYNTTILNLNTNGTAGIYTSGGAINKSNTRLLGLRFENTTTSAVNLDYETNAYVYNVSGYRGATYFVDSLNVTNSLFESLDLFNNTGTTSLIIFNTGNINNTIKNSRIDTARGAGIISSSPTNNGLYIYNNTIIQNTTESGSAAYGISLTGIKNIQIENNTITNAVIGILLQSENANVTRNTIFNTTISASILVQTFANNTIISLNNIASPKGAAAGIQVGTSNNTLIINNTLTQGRGTDIRIAVGLYTGNVLVENNTITNNQGTTGYGLYVTGTNGNVTFRNNYINGVGGQAGNSGCMASISANSTIFENNRCNNISLGVVTSTNSDNNIIRNNVFTNVSTRNVDISGGSDNNMFTSNNYTIGMGVRVSSIGYGNYFIDAQNGWEFNVTESLGTITINRTATFLSISSTASGVNNITIYNLTNALIFNQTRIVAGSSDINANDGTISILNFDGTANNITILNNYNITEGVTRERDIIAVTKTDQNIRVYTYSLLDNINATAYILASSNYLSRADFLTSVGFTQAIGRNEISSVGNYVGMTLLNINNGANTLTLVYGCTIIDLIILNIIKILLPIGLVLGVVFLIFSGKFNLKKVTMGTIVVVFITITISVVFIVQISDSIFAVCGAGG